MSMNTTPEGPSSAAASAHRALLGHPGAGQPVRAHPDGPSRCPACGAEVLGAETELDLATMLDRLQESIEVAGQLAEAVRRTIAELETEPSSTLRFPTAALLRAALSSWDKSFAMAPGRSSSPI